MTEVSLRDILPVWWAYFWRFFIISSIAGALAVAAVSFGLGLMGVRTGQWGFWPGQVIGFAVSVPISMWAMRAALTRHYFGVDVRISRR